MAYSMENMLKLLYTAQTKINSSEVKEVTFKEYDDYYLYKVVVEVKNPGKVYDKILPIKIKKFYTDEGQLSKSTINISLYKGAIRLWPENSNTINGISLGLDKQNSIYIDKKTGEMRVGLDNVYKFKDVDNAIRSGNVDSLDSAIKNYKLEDAVLAKLELIADTELKSDLLIDPRNWKIIMDYFDGVYGNTPIYTPFDFESFNYLEGLAKELWINKFRIQQDVRSQLNLNYTVSYSSVAKIINQYIIGNLSTLRLVQSTKDTSPLSMLSQENKLLFVNPRNNYEKLRVNSKYFNGVIDQFRTNDSPNINIYNELVLSAEVDSTVPGGFTTLVYDKDFNEKRISIREYLSSRILAYENVDYNAKKIKPKNGKYSYSLRCKYYSTSELQYDYIRHPKSLVSISTAQIPLLNRNSPARTIIAAHYLTQTLPLVHGTPKIISTEYTKEINKNTNTSILSDGEYTVKDILEDSSSILLESPSGKTHYTKKIDLYNMTDSHTFNVYKLNVKIGDKVKTGDVLYRLNAFNTEGDFCNGIPLLTCYTTYRNREVDDGYVLCETAIPKFDHEECYTLKIPFYKDKYIIDETSILPVPGQKIAPNDIIIKYNEIIDNPGAMLSALNIKASTKKTSIFRLPEEYFDGYVSSIEVKESAKPDKDYEYYKIVDNWKNQVMKEQKRYYKNPYLIYFTDSKELVGNGVIKNSDELETVEFYIEINIVYKNRMKISDKMTNLYSTKGVLVEVVPKDKMLRLEDGTVIECIQPPLSIGTRKNLGSVYETKLSLIAKRLYDLAKTKELDDKKYEKMLETLFPELKPRERCSEYLLAHRNIMDKFLQIIVDNFDTVLNDELIDKYLELVGIPDGGLVTVIDGASGRKIRNKLLVGYSYYFRMAFLAEVKGKATPDIFYSNKSVFLNSKYRKEGQKIGELEIHALLGTGARDFLKVTDSAVREKSAQIVSEFEKLMLKIV